MTDITSKFRTDVAKLFIDDVQTGNYYLFASHDQDELTTSSASSIKSLLERTVFGKRIDPEEVYHAIRNYPWQQNTIYTQYDDQTDLADQKYYAVVYPENNETGDYKVYKCLFNNYGSESINAPNYSDVTPDQIYETGDGYVWKYMYSLTEFEFDKYNTRGYIPIFQEANTSTVSTGEINQIFITNPDTNRGYESVDGTIFQVLRGGENKVVISVVSGAINPIENYYANYSFYVTNENNTSQIYEVNSFVYNSPTKATITLKEGVPEDGVLAESSSFQILPSIKILGDGSGAVAIPRLSPEDGNINRIIVINEGAGYTRATATIPDPFGFDPNTLSSVDEKIILRPIVSPRASHGTNLAEELSSRHAIIYNGFNEFDNEVIPATNTFSRIGIVKNPEFKTANTTPDIFNNTLEVLLDGHSLEVDEIVTQIETNPESEFYNEITFMGKVNEISGNTIWLREYMGAYPNNLNSANTEFDFSDISINAELPLYSSRDEILVINIAEDAVKSSNYIQRSGEVYYTNSFAPITRTEESREQIKVVIEF